MEKSPNSKSSQKKNSRTGPKQRKNRSTQAKQPTARFLESWFPSISNDLLKAPSAWWNVLAAEECVRSPQARASAGSKHTLERRAADASDREALVFSGKNRLGRGWRVEKAQSSENRDDSAAILGRADEQPFRSGDVAEPRCVLELDHFEAFQHCTVLAEPDERL